MPDEAFNNFIKSGKIVLQATFVPYHTYHIVKCADTKYNLGLYEKKSFFVIQHNVLPGQRINTV